MVVGAVSRYNDKTPPLTPPLVGEGGYDDKVRAPLQRIYNTHLQQPLDSFLSFLLVNILVNTHSLPYN